MNDNGASVLKYLATGIAGAALGAVAAYLYLMNALPGQMVSVYESPYGFEQTVQHIERKVASAGWKMPKVYDLKKSLAEAGYDVPRITVFSMCNPHHANRLLSQDDARFVSAMMPCRVAVYEHGGSTRIATMNVGAMSALFGDRIEEVMTDVADEQAEMLSDLLRKSVP